jgi:UDP-N-acetylmuramoylalanine--D-glutamate ligase
MKISLFGYGNTNKAIAQTLKNCDIFDDSFKSESFDEYGNRLLPSHLFDPDSSDLEIITPGIPPHHPLAKSAKNLMSDYDYYYDRFAFSIWISGTNGKTTTTQMLKHLLKSKGAIAGGNIGKAVAKMDTKANIWILESSSFTLHYTNRAKPNIYILLPIESDHISWHGSFSEYESSKLKPLDNMQEGEMAIVPYKYRDYESDAFLVPYKDSHDLADFFDIDLSKIETKEPFLLDALLALGVSKALYDEIDYKLINSFRPDAHKLQEFKDSKNRLWVDDSKATNTTATIEALKRYKNTKIYIILGGDDKGADLKPLYDMLKTLDYKAFTIGSSSQKLAQNLPNSIVCSSLEKAVDLIDKEFKDGVGLLSPACASLDQFSSYKERGDDFKLHVNKI